MVSIHNKDHGLNFQPDLQVPTHMSIFTLKQTQLESWPYTLIYTEVKSLSITIHPGVLL